MKKLLILLIIITGIPAFPNPPDNIQLKGKVYDENRNAVKNLSIRFSSYGTAVTTNSGEFIIEIPDGVQTCDIALTNENLSILYPVDQRIAIPIDRNYIMKIVVGKASPASPGVDDITKNYFRLEAVLKEIGVSQNDLSSLIEDFIRRESAEREVEEENLKAAIYREKRNEKFSAISAALLKYMLKTRNVKNSYKVATEFNLRNMNALRELVKVGEEYNLAFNEINNNKFAYRGDVALFWDNKILADTLYDIFNYILDEVHHACIISLNDEVTELNKLVSSFYEDEDEEEEARRKITDGINYTVKELEARLPVLDKRISNVLIKMQDDI